MTVMVVMVDIVYLHLPLMYYLYSKVLYVY